MFIFFDGKSLKPALIKVSGSFGTMMCVPTHRVRMSQPAKKLGNLSVGFWADNEVPMIWHHDIRENRKRNAIESQAEHSLKCLVVFFFFKKRQTSNCTVDNVEASSCWTNSRATRHHSILASRQNRINELRPLSLPDTIPNQIGVNGHVRFVSTMVNPGRTDSGRITGIGSTKTTILSSVKLPHEKCAQEIIRFSDQSKYQVAIPPESSVNLNLEVEEGYDFEEEWKELAILFSHSGLKIVREGGIADFNAVLRKNALDVQDHFDTPSPGKKFKMEIVLVAGKEVVWRAARDQSATSLNEAWSGFVIPRTFNIVKRNLNLSSFKAGRFIDAPSDRDYSRGWMFKSGGGSRNGRN